MAQDEDQISRLTSVRTEMEAGVLVAELEECGIRSAISGVHTANFRAEAPGWVDVLVADKDRDRALSFLDDVKREQSNIDWDAVDVGEPDEDLSTVDSQGTSRWSNWRRICLLLVGAYLIWLVAGMVFDVIRFAWRH